MPPEMWWQNGEIYEKESSRVCVPCDSECNIAVCFWNSIFTAGFLILDWICHCAWDPDPARCQTYASEDKVEDR